MGSLIVEIKKRLDTKTKIFIGIGFIFFIISIVFVSSNLMDEVTKASLNKCIDDKQDLYDYCNQELYKCNNPYESAQIPSNDEVYNVFPK